MRKIYKLLLPILFFQTNVAVQAQTSSPKINEQMRFLGAYNAGQPGVNIYKMFDPVEDVLCYIMMPVVAGRRQLENGSFIYDGNTIGSMSCMKIKALPVYKPLDEKK